MNAEANFFSRASQWTTREKSRLFTLCQAKDILAKYNPRYSFPEYPQKSLFTAGQVHNLINGEPINKGLM